MSLICALGLAACMTYGGHTYTAQEAVDISDGCYDLSEAPPETFRAPPAPIPGASPRDTFNQQLRFSKGFIFAEWLDDKGLKLDWNVSPGSRRASWLQTCRSFAVVFNDKSRWTHMEKWPWKSMSNTDEKRG